MKLLTALGLALLTTACAPSESTRTMTPDKTLRGHGDSSSIAMHITFHIKPEFEHAFVEFAAGVAARVYDQEPGVLTYTMYKHPTEPSTYVFIERYRDEAALDAHMATPIMAEAMEKLPDWLAAPPVEVRYQQLLPR